MRGTLTCLTCMAVAVTPSTAFLMHPSCVSVTSTLTSSDGVARLSSSCRQRRNLFTAAISMSSKGFGPPPPKRDPQPKSKKRVETDQASKSYDEMAAAGIPEYNIFIKPKGTEDYLPAGVMAVPRSQQVSEAIFEQEENLKAAAFKFYDKLKNYDEFEYGYTLKMFPDDPVTPIEKRAPSTNPVSRFFEGLFSPVNTAGMKGPPVDPPPL